MSDIRTGDISNLNGSILNIGSGEVNVHLPTPGIAALHQLPDPPADFVGRTTELEALCAGAGQKNILIHGLGGVGKTALGLVLVRQLKANYPDGQLYIHLRGASENPMAPAAALEQLIRAFAPVARLPEDVEQLAAVYRSLLAEKRVLVFLDDARNAAQVRPLLPPRPALVILTSRQRIDLAGSTTLDVSALPMEDAVKLIGAVWDQTGEVTALATRCGCLPMALRSVGALLHRRPDLTPSAVAALLDDAARRLELADPERDDLTVAAVFQTSHDQLSPEQQTHWRALGVFPADFDAAAAAAVWGLDTGRSMVVDGLDYGALAAWAGISAAANDQPVRSPGELLAGLHAAGLVEFIAGSRWRLHDLVRDFVRSLCSPIEFAALAHRHAAYYQNILTESNRLYLEGGESILAGLTLFDRERTNIETGQAWAAAHGANPAARELCNEYPNAGFKILHLRLHPRIYINWLEASLIAARALRNHRYEAFHLGNLGNAWSVLGEPHRAIAYYEQQLNLARETGDRLTEGNALGNLGIVYKDLGDAARAVGYGEQHLAIAREINHRQGEGEALGNLGHAYRVLGELHQAVECYEQCLALARETGNRLGEEGALGSLGNVHQMLGEPDRARVFYEQQLAIAREIGNRRSEGHALGSLGCIYERLGDFDRALGFLEEARRLHHEVDDRQGEAKDSWNLGLLLEAQGQPARAAELMQLCVDYERYIGHPDAGRDAARVEAIRQRL